jgi:hypothetical protein
VFIVNASNNNKQLILEETMKKLALILALIIIPCSAFGLEMLNDNAMDEVTGQAGVAIAFDDVQLFLNVDRFAWVDCDGFSTHSNFGGTCAGSGAAIVIEDFQMDTININMIGTAGTFAAFEYTASSAGIQTTGGGLNLASSTCGQIPLFYDYGTGAVVGCTLDNATGAGLGLNNYINTNISDSSGLAQFNAKALTIDVSMELPLLSGGLHANDIGSSGMVGGVLIGLPTAEFYIHSMTITPTVTALISANSVAHETLMRNEGESYGTFVIEGITFTVLNGWMEIAPTGNPTDIY